MAPTTNNDNTPLTDLAGYKVYYRTASNYNYQSIDVGNVATHTLNNLTNGVTYYFAIAAYNTSNTESNYSNEMCYNSTSTCTSSNGSGSSGTNSSDASISGGGCGFIKSSDNNLNSGPRITDLSIMMLLLLLILFRIKKMNHLYKYYLWR